MGLLGSELYRVLAGNGTLNRSPVPVGADGFEPPWAFTTWFTARSIRPL
jgi:hypothetical protein